MVFAPKVAQFSVSDQGRGAADSRASSSEARCVPSRTGHKGAAGTLSCGTLVQYVLTRNWSIERPDYFFAASTFMVLGLTSSALGMVRVSTPFS
jgi:hypothetical protein